MVALTTRRSLTPNAAVAKLEFVVQALGQGGSAYDDDLIGQVLGWVRAH